MFYFNIIKIKNQIKNVQKSICIGVYIKCSFRNLNYKIYEIISSRKGTVQYDHRASCRIKGT